MFFLILASLQSQILNKKIKHVVGGTTCFSVAGVMRLKIIGFTDTCSSLAHDLKLKVQLASRSTHVEDTTLILIGWCLTSS